MSDMNAHLRNIHLQNLVEENQDLRRRVAKLTEIQSYVELLVDKLDQAERREKQIGNDNGLLRQQARQLELKFTQNQAMHGEEMRYVFSQHDQLLDQKNQALMQLKGIIELEQARALQLQAQLRAQQQDSIQWENELKAQRQTVKQLQAQLKAQRSHQQQLISEYESGMMQCRSKISEMQQDLQILYQTFQEQKGSHLNTKESWMSEIGQFKAVLKEKQQQIITLDQHIKQLEGTVMKLQDENNLLKNYGKQMELKHQKRQEDNQVQLHNLQQNFRKKEQENMLHLRNFQQNFRTREEENKQTVLTLQNNIEQLRMDLQLRKSENITQQNVCNALNKQIQELKLNLSHSKQDNESYVTDNQRLIFLLEQSDRENIFLREKVHEVEDYASKEIEKAKLDNLKLREENGVLSKNNHERENYLNTRLVELKEVINARNSLQLALENAQGDLSMFSEQCGELQQRYGQEKQRNIQLQIQNKSLSDANSLIKKELMTIEELNNRLQKQSLQIETENHNLTRLISNPRELSKDYVDQIDKMLKNFHSERQEQDKRHWLEKEKLKEMYQYEFRQKQMQFRRQISLLQQQISRTRKFQIAVERSAGRQTPAKPKR